ncbi:MAG TPA: Crp/Fnr family transcriptional regulator [Vicinamibacterales bacterium]
MTMHPASLNHLLATLPEAEQVRIAPQLMPVALRGRQVLHKRGEPLQHVLFPGRMLCSLVLTMQDGASAEIAVVGAEGVVGVEAALGVRVAACDATVQVAGEGHAMAMTVSAFQAELANCPAFESRVRNYAQAFVGFVMQSVACNARHSVDARCCRWLLHAHDRLAADDLELTHDLLSTMLGVRRPTVTLVMNDLSHAGIVSTGRGRIRIVDRTALEARACACYRIVTEIYGMRARAEAKVVAGASTL